MGGIVVRLVDEEEREGELACGCHAITSFPPLIEYQSQLQTVYSLNVYSAQKAKPKVQVLTCIGHNFNLICGQLDLHNSSFAACVNPSPSFFLITYRIP